MKGFVHTHTCTGHDQVRMMTPWRQPTSLVTLIWRRRGQPTIVKGVGKLYQWGGAKPSHWGRQERSDLAEGLPGRTEKSKGHQ